MVEREHAGVVVLVGQVHLLEHVHRLEAGEHARHAAKEEEGGMSIMQLIYIYRNYKNILNTVSSLRKGPQQACYVPVVPTFFVIFVSDLASIVEKIIKQVVINPQLKQT